MTLDDILFPGLANGGFQSGDLTGWRLSTTGSVAVLPSSVPEPSTFAFLGVGSLVFLIARRRRTK